MSGGKAMASSKSVAGGKKKGLLKNLMQYREYYIMLIPGFLFFLIFCYGPMYGLVIAFQDYYPLKGISGSRLWGSSILKACFPTRFSYPC